MITIILTTNIDKYAKYEFDILCLNCIVVYCCCIITYIKHI